MSVSALRTRRSSIALAALAVLVLPMTASPGAAQQQLGAIQGTITDRVIDNTANFGRVTGVRDPRIIQLGAKPLF